MLINLYFKFQKNLKNISYLSCKTSILDCITHLSYDSFVDFKKCKQDMEHYLRSFVTKYSDYV